MPARCALTALVLASPVLCSPMTTHMPSRTASSAICAHVGTLAAISMSLKKRWCADLVCVCAWGRGLRWHTNRWGACRPLRSTHRKVRQRSSMHLHLSVLGSPEEFVDLHALLVAGARVGDAHHLVQELPEGRRASIHDPVLPGGRIGRSAQGRW